MLNYKNVSFTMKLGDVTFRKSYNSCNKTRIVKYENVGKIKKN